MKVLNSQWKEWLLKLLRYDGNMEVYECATQLSWGMSEKSIAMWTKLKDQGKTNTSNWW